MYYKQYYGEGGDVPQGKTFYMHEPALRHINPEGTWAQKEGEKIDVSGKVDELIKTDIPCWSVGRLIEIYLTCALEYHPYDDFYTETPSLHLMAFDKDRLIEEVIEIMSEDKMDFSKLEE